MTGTLREVVYDNISLNSTQNDVSGKICKEYQNTLLCSITFYLKKSVLYEIMLKNMVVPERSQIIWRTHFVYWITKATNTHILRTCNTHCSSTATMVTRRRLDVTLYIYCLSCIQMLLMNVRLQKEKYEALSNTAVIMSKNLA
jgi:hypothetical protein